MKTYRQREKQGSKVQESTKGPDEAKIKVKLDKIEFNDEIACLLPRNGFYSSLFFLKLVFRNVII